MIGRRAAHSAAIERETVRPARVESTPAEDLETVVRRKAPWSVILFNDDVHTFDEVILQVIKATRCSLSQAERYVWQAHMTGRSRVFDGPMDDCLQVQGVLREIALRTEIQG